MCCCEVPDLGQCKPLELRPVTFHDAARAEVRAMPKPARSAFGKLLLKLQCGESLSMPHSRPMPNIAAGVAEIRIADASGHYRVFFWKSLATGILVVHAFMKKTSATPWHVIALVQRRLKEIRHDTP